LSFDRHVGVRNSGLGRQSNRSGTPQLQSPRKGTPVRQRLSLLLSCVLASVSLVGVASLANTAQASPADDYVGGHFGNGNLPAGCIVDRRADNPANTCYHAKVGLNALDSPIIDVALVIPASPTAERDLRMLQQVVKMWDGGIHYLAGEMGMDWLQNGVKFHITPTIVGAATGTDEVSTYPLYDPEIVVVMTNPAGGAGIGTDPAYLTDQLGIMDENGVGCDYISNPFSMDTWKGMPGYDGHHGDAGGIYTEDCGGAGGNVCFAINGIIDPVPGTTDTFSIFDVVSHEFGHCLTLGHVGDGADGVWGPVPTADIMAYSYDPPGQDKCVSTQNVEGFALRMSHYIDRNGDGAVTAADALEPNDKAGDGLNSFQIMSQDDYRFASSTGSVWDCPQPNYDTVPGTTPDPDWTPDPVDTDTPVLNVTSPAQGAQDADGNIAVTGTVGRQPLHAPPTSTTASGTDPTGDAKTPLTDIEQLDVQADELDVTATLKVAQLWPSTQVESPQKYSISIGGRQIDSYIPNPASPAEVATYDHSTEQQLPIGWSTWDTVANTVTFHVPRSYLAAAQVKAPYTVFAMADYWAPDKYTLVVDDRAPDAGQLGITAPAGTVPTATSTPGARVTTIHLERPNGGNFFYAYESSLASDNVVWTAVAGDRAHYFTLDVPNKSDVDVLLSWYGPYTKLDLSVTGAATGSSNSGSPERVAFKDVQGQLKIKVNPYLIATTALQQKYTLTATLTAPAPDTDADGVFDEDDQCPAIVGVAPFGCPDADHDGVSDVLDINGNVDKCLNKTGNDAEGCLTGAPGQVNLYVDGVLAGSEPVDVRHHSDTFNIPATVSPGNHELRTEWVDRGVVVDTDSRTITYATGTTDQDGDGDNDGGHDNCSRQPNPTQSDIDHDGKGDACDNDIDGDGYNNNKERAAGTDPYDPKSYPIKTTSTTVL